MDRIKFKCFSLFVLVLWAVRLIPVGYAASPTQPHLQPNMLSNPGFNGLSNWILSYGAQYDAGVSRTSDGSGSVKLPPSGIHLATSCSLGGCEMRSRD